MDSFTSENEIILHFLKQKEIMFSTVLKSDPESILRCKRRRSGRPFAHSACCHSFLLPEIPASAPTVLSSAPPPTKSNRLRLSAILTYPFL